MHSNIDHNLPNIDINISRRLLTRYIRKLKELMLIDFVIIKHESEPKAYPNEKNCKKAYKCNVSKKIANVKLKKAKIAIVIEEIGG